MIIRKQQAVDTAKRVGALVAAKRKVVAIAAAIALPMGLVTTAAVENENQIAPAKAQVAASMPKPTPEYIFVDKTKIIVKKEPPKIVVKTKVVTKIRTVTKIVPKYIYRTRTVVSYNPFR